MAAIKRKDREDRASLKQLDVAFSIPAKDEIRLDPNAN